MKKSMIFALDGMLLDKDYGARYVDAIGLNNVLKNSRAFQDNIITDKPNNYNIDEFDTICIIPKNEGLFDGRDDFKEFKQNQYDFIKRLKTIPVNKRPKIIMFFNDVNIGLHGKYNHEKDFFSSLTFNCVYAFRSDEKYDARDIFIDKEYQKHICMELETEWIVAAHLDSILEQGRNNDNIFVEDVDTNEIDSFYYGDYRPGIVDSLNKIKKGKGFLIGNKQLADETGMQYLSEKLPMCTVRKYIHDAKYNLVPFEELKTNKQITARIIELIVFGRENLDHIVFDGWNFLDREKTRTKEQAINDLLKISKTSSDEIMDLIMRG